MAQDSQDTPKNDEPLQIEDRPNSATDGKKNKRKRPAEIQYSGEGKEAETVLAGPAKTSRNDGQKSARNWPQTAPSALTIRPQPETARQQPEMLDPIAPRNSPQLPPTPSPVTKEVSPMLLTDRLHPQDDTPATPDIFHTRNPLLQLSAESHANAAQTYVEQSPQSSMRDRMAEIAEQGETVNMDRPNFRNPLDKYTDAKMDDVHYNHPMAILKNIDLDIIGSWETIPNGKLLAQPFGAYANRLESYGTLKALIFAAVVEITNAKGISVCTPRRSPTANRNPNSFLIHNLTEKQWQTLLLRGVWSSTNITFRVVPLAPKCPNFLFSIKGFTTQTIETVFNAVHKVWHDSTTDAFLNGISNQVRESDRVQANLALHKFTNSMWITMLDTRNKGNILAPTFCVYASGDIINEDRTWCRLRTYLASRSYVIPFQDPGVNIIPSMECSICHGSDHPRGLCSFPTIPGWNGPTRREDPPLVDPITGRKDEETVQFRDRNRTTGRGHA